MQLPYVNRYVSAVLASAEEEKKHKYLSALSYAASFTPTVYIDGALGHEALMFFAVSYRYIGYLVVG